MHFLRRTGNWIARYPLSLIFAAACYSLGLLTMLPLGFAIPESASGFLGAIVGAVAGIGGALAVVHATDFIQGKNIAEYVLFSYEPAASHFGNIADFIERADATTKDREWSPNTWEKFIKELRSGVKLIEEAQLRIRRVEPNVHRMVSSALHVSNLLEARSNAAREAMADIIDSQTEAVRFYGGKLDEELQARFVRTARDMAREMLDLAGIYGMRRKVKRHQLASR